jgi:NAD(P)H-hydrate repair Nnr-like enzyme with NAD(P)H-hydrate epimerase domain
VIETSGGFPVSRASSIPTVTAGQMAEIDRLAVADFGIDILQMMEHAGSVQARRRR